MRDFVKSLGETIYRITGGFLYAATSNFKRVTGRVFTISVFLEQAKTLSFNLIIPTLARSE
jgi:hypothetical protein